MTGGSILVDTNVVVYAYDRGQPEKQERALSALQRLASAGRGRLSAQVLAEFFRVATGKLPAPLSGLEAERQIGLLARAWTVLPITPMIVLEAVRGARAHRLAYWDAQIWATARLNQIDMILTEDFQADRVLEGVRFVNPFVPAFDPAALG
jgi:predicted nucleic acid-binding protein